MHGKHVLVWMIGIFVELILVAVFVPPSRLLQLINHEVAACQYYFGDQTASGLMLNANKVFAGELEKPRKASERAYVKDPGDPAGLPLAPGIKNIIRGTNHVVISFWMMLYLGLLRLYIFSLWLWPVLILLMAAGMDGYSAYRKKMYTFGFSNPLLYNTATHLLIIACFLPLAYLVAPLPMSPLFLLAWAALMIVPVEMLCSNFPRTPT